MRRRMFCYQSKYIPAADCALPATNDFQRIKMIRVPSAIRAELDELPRVSGRISVAYDSRDALKKTTPSFPAFRMFYTPAGTPLLLSNSSLRIWPIALVPRESSSMARRAAFRMRLVAEAPGSTASRRRIASRTAATSRSRMARSCSVGRRRGSMRWRAFSSATQAAQRSEVFLIRTSSARSDSAIAISRCANSASIVVRGSFTVDPPLPVRMVGANRNRRHRGSAVSAEHVPVHTMRRHTAKVPK